MVSTSGTPSIYPPIFFFNEKLSSFPLPYGFFAEHSDSNLSSVLEDGVALLQINAPGSC